MYICNVIKNKQMETKEEKLKAYNEAKEICSKYLNYKGDKRTVIYKRLSHTVIDCYMGRMNSFGKLLGLPSYTEYFFGSQNKLHEVKETEF